MTTIGERIDQFLREKGLTHSEMAKKLGVTKSAVGLWVSNRNSISPKHIIQLYLLYPDLNLRWLLTGNGDMLQSQKQEDAYTSKIIENLKYENQLLRKMIAFYENRSVHSSSGQCEKTENR